MRTSANKIAHPDDIEEMDFKMANGVLLDYEGLRSQSGFSCATTATRGDILTRECRAQENQATRTMKDQRRSVPVEIYFTALCHVMALVDMNGLWKFHASTPDLSFTSLDEFVNEPVVENYKAMSSEEEPKVVRKYDDAPSIKEWVSDNEEEDVSQPKTKKKTIMPSIVKKEFLSNSKQQ
ncbi:hypothetical protein Tco_0105043 [Tanacetum coccineum]